MNNYPTLQPTFEHFEHLLTTIVSDCQALSGDAMPLLSTDTWQSITMRLETNMHAYANLLHTVRSGNTPLDFTAFPSITDIVGQE